MGLQPHAGYARMNRVFKDKPGGLVVDYIGIANDLKAALKTYTDSICRQSRHLSGPSLSDIPSIRNP